MEKQIKATIIIPTRNRGYVLKYCLENILNQSCDSYEVIVVDDASEDETPEINATCKMLNANFRYIRLNERKGPYVARNIGVEEAKGEVIIFIDSDVIVHPKFVSQHTSIHEKRKNEKIWVQGMVHHTRRLEGLETGASFRGHYPNALCIDNFITQNVSVPKKYLVEVGGFDTFGSLIGYKDVAMGIKLRRIGLHPVNAIISCKAYHIDGPSTQLNLNEFFSKQELRGKSAYFFREQYGEEGKKFAHTEKALFISRFFRTDKWAEDRGVRFLDNSQDSPILPLFPFIRMLVKYHYRAKGILEVQSEKCKVKSEKKKTSTLDALTHQHLNSQTPDASVIVVTFNRGKLLGYCLGRLLNQTAKNYEIVVIDDGSTDNTATLPEMKMLRYFKNPKQSGQPFSRNRGVKEARGDIIIFVDSDVLVDSNFVQDHIDAHKKSDKLIVQGLVRHVRAPRNAGKFSLRIDGFSLTGLVTQNVSIRKKWLYEAGLMDEHFGISMGYEDTDLGRRIRKLGVRAVHGFRKCKAYHVDGYPTAEKFKISFQKRYEWSKNIVYFGKKHGERFVKANKVFTVSRLLQTNRWVEKEAALKILVSSTDCPIFFISPILKELMKYHYRAKGILEAQTYYSKTY